MAEFLLTFSAQIDLEGVWVLTFECVFRCSLHRTAPTNITNNVFLSNDNMSISNLLISKRKKHFYCRAIAGVSFTTIFLSSVAMAGEIVEQEREIQVQEIATKPSFDFARPECQGATYPRQSLIHEEQGTVLLDVDVNELGQATSTKVTKSSGFLRLDKAIQQFLLEGGCKATPAMLNGKAVKGTAHVTYVWKLN